MIFILSLSGGEANHFVKYKNTALTGKERLYLKAGDVILSWGGRAECVSQHS